MHLNLLLLRAALEQCTHVHKLGAIFALFIRFSLYIHILACVFISIVIFCPLYNNANIQEKLLIAVIPQIQCYVGHVVYPVGIVGFHFKREKKKLFEVFVLWYSRTGYLHMVVEDLVKYYELRNNFFESFLSECK